MTEWTRFLHVTEVACLQLGDVAAGSSIDTLSFGCIDEVDRPVAAAVKGKVMCGWMRKARTASIEGDCTCVMLPKLKVPQQVISLSCHLPVAHYDTTVTLP